MKTFISIILLLTFLFLGNSYSAQQSLALSDCLSNPSSNLQKACSLSRSYLEPVNLHRIGKGSNNVVQTLALDQKSRVLYSLNVAGRPEKGVINRYKNIDNKTDLIAMDAQLPTNVIGHQGLSVLPDSDWLLSSTGNAVENNGWYITLFQYSPNGIPQLIRNVKVFDSTFDNTASSMPVITPNGHYLIVRGKKDKLDVIRIFDIRNIDLLKDSDISNDYLHTWSVSRDFTGKHSYFQGITSDNDLIYMLSGKVDQSHKKLFIYNMVGEEVERINVKLGQQDSLLAGNISYWEPESLTIDSENKSLIILFAMGDKGKRLAKFYTVKLHP